MAAVNYCFEKKELQSSDRLSSSHEPGGVDETVFSVTESSKEMPVSTNTDECGILVEGLTASWYMEQDKLVLSDISCSVTKASKLFYPLYM